MNLSYGLYKFFSTVGRKYLIEIPAMAMVTLGQLNVCDSQSSNCEVKLFRKLDYYSDTRIREWSKLSRSEVNFYVCILVSIFQVP
jgi:hypothetical protein